MWSGSWIFLLLWSLSPLFIKQTYQQQQETYIRGVHVVFRHGDRNPIRSYPGDPYSNESYYWPEGFGAVTERGRVRVFNLGKYMRRRYPTFLRKNVIIYSSDTNRTVSSAMSCLAGFYGQSRSFLKTVNAYSPKGFGIRVIPKDEDDFILIHKQCPKYTKLQQQFVERINYMKKFADVSKIISANTGVNSSTFNVEVVLIADIFVVQKSRNLKLPDWAEPLAASGIFQEIRDAYFPSLMPTSDMKRLKSGVMVKKFIDEMDHVVSESLKLPNNDQNDQTPKITLISGHDSSLVFWLIDFDIFDGHGPPYGSALLMELHEPVISSAQRSKGFIFKLYYKNDSDSEPLLMSIPGCPNPCLYTDLKHLLQPFVVDNWDEECRIQENSNSAEDSFSTDIYPNAAIKIKSTMKAVSSSFSGNPFTLVLTIITILVASYFSSA